MQRPHAESRGEPPHRVSLGPDEAVYTRQDFVHTGHAGDATAHEQCERHLRPHRGHETADQGLDRHLRRASQWTVSGQGKPGFHQGKEKGIQAYVMFRWNMSLTRMVIVEEVTRIIVYIIN